MRYENSNKIPVPRVMFMAEESIIVLRRPHARTVRPHQWHIIKGSHTVKKELRGGG